MLLGISWIAICAYSEYRRCLSDLAGGVGNFPDGKGGQPFNEALTWVEIAGDERDCRARNVSSLKNSESR
jgi:hypothetical protein